MLTRLQFLLFPFCSPSVICSLQHCFARGMLLKYRSDHVSLLFKNIWCLLTACFCKLQYELLETWKAFKAFPDLTPIHFTHLTSTIDAFAPLRSHQPSPLLPLSRRLCSPKTFCLIGPPSLYSIPTPIFSAHSDLSKLCSHWSLI